jgi:hypothetical protein
VTTDQDFYIEVHCQQRNHVGERICGDVFLKRRIKEENRTIVVLSDGMGHGVKANLLATLTATMAMNFTQEHKDVERIADTIMNTLPVCADRKISYSTFTIVDIEHDGEIRILEYDNPRATLLRGKNPLPVKWERITMETERNKGKVLRTCRFYPQKDDRIVFYTDGVAQSGLGVDQYPFGWGEESVDEYIKELVENDPEIAASTLASKIVTRAHKNDHYNSKDDTSCAAIYFRDPRKCLVCSGPPYEKKNDKVLGEKVKSFNGARIVSGATTADIVARETGVEITDSFEFEDPDLPPVSYMDGIDLVTEGILTLSKVSDLLRTYGNETRLGKGPADQIVKILLDSDEIHFIIGTRINIAHQDPNLPVDLEIRRTVIKRIARRLEDKFLKEVFLEYI